MGFRELGLFLEKTIESLQIPTLVFWLSWLSKTFINTQIEYYYVSNIRSSIKGRELESHLKNLNGTKKNEHYFYGNLTDKILNNEVSYQLLWTGALKYHLDGTVYSMIIVNQKLKLLELHKKTKKKLIQILASNFKLVGWTFLTFRSF